MSFKCFPGDGYDQDLIAPTRIEHRVEYGDWDEKSQTYGFWYDFLIYEFREGDKLAEAVAYMDEESVELRVLDPNDPTSDFAIKVLVFLSLRYATLKIMEGSGSYSFDEHIREKVEQQKISLFKKHKD